jgi:hypothetical protein
MDASGGAQRSPHEQWPYESKFKRVNGWRMHYIDEGAGDLAGCSSRQCGMGLSVPKVHEGADRGGQTPDRSGHDRFRPVREAHP